MVSSSAIILYAIFVVGASTSRRFADDRELPAQRFNVSNRPIAGRIPPHTIQKIGRVQNPNRSNNASVRVGMRGRAATNARKSAG